MKYFVFFFAVPSTSSGRKKGRSTTLIQMAIKKLTLSEECLEGKLELGIPWDPLAISTTKMENCQKNLQSLSLWSREKEEQGGRLEKQNALPYSKETFHKTSIHGEDFLRNFPKAKQRRLNILKSFTVVLLYLLATCVSSLLLVFISPLIRTLQ